MYRFLLLCALVGLVQAAQAAKTLDKTLGWPGETLAGTPCFGKDSNFGPFDYTDPQATVDGGRYSYTTGGRVSPLRMVEGPHFPPEVENLISGKRGPLPEPDIDYTLRAFPNHHRALWAMSRFYLRRLASEDEEQLRNDERARRGYPPPECYFQRAMFFAPGDPMVRAVFGIYLHRRGQLDIALASYQEAEKALPENSELVYNMGLLYFDMGQLDKAKEYAERARALGYPLQGLQRKISQKERE